MTHTTAAERHDFIDARIELVNQTLAHPRAAELLGAETVSHLAEVTSSLFVPNYDGQGIEFPKSKIDSNEVPIVAMFEGDLYFNDNPDALVLARKQAENVDFYLAAKGLSVRKRQRKITRATKKLRESRSYLPSSFPKLGERYNPIGFVTRMRVPIRLGMSEIEIHGRPALILNGQLRTTTDYYAPSLIHEIVHVGQIIDHPVAPFGGPVKNYDTTESEELEAYYIQHRAELVQGITEPTLAKSVHDSIEAHKADNVHPFAPHEAIRLDLSSVDFIFQG